MIRPSMPFEQGGIMEEEGDSASGRRAEEVEAQLDPKDVLRQHSVRPELRVPEII